MFVMPSAKITKKHVQGNKNNTEEVIDWIFNRFTRLVQKLLRHMHFNMQSAA